MSWLSNPWVIGIISGLIVFVLVAVLSPQVRKMPYWWRNRRLQNFISLQTSIRSKATLYEFVEWYYTEIKDYHSQLLRPFGRPFPILVFPAQEAERCNIESPIKGGLYTDSRECLDKDLERAGHKFLDILRMSDRPPWDGTTYRLVGLEVTEKPKMKCGLGSYFSALTTSDVLDFELLTKFNDRNPGRSQFERFAKELKLAVTCIR